jgi:hypothetical protein
VLYFHERPVCFSLDLFGNNGKEDNFLKCTFVIAEVVVMLLTLSVRSFFFHHFCCLIFSCFSVSIVKTVEAMFLSFLLSVCTGRSDSEAD